MTGRKVKRVYRPIMVELECGHHKEISKHTLKLLDIDDIQEVSCEQCDPFILHGPPTVGKGGEAKDEGIDR